MKKQIFLTTASIVLLLISLAYAWMGTGAISNVDQVIFQYGDGSEQTIGVEATDFAVRIYLSETGQAGSWQETDDDGPLMQFTNWVPSKSIFFKLRLYNYSDADISFNVQLSNISANVTNENGTPKLIEVLFLSMISCHGYADDYPFMPDEFFTPMMQLLHQKSDGTFAAQLFSTLHVPPTGPRDPDGNMDNENFVEVTCYVNFNQMADISYANCDLTIGSLLFVL